MQVTTVFKYYPTFEEASNACKTRFGTQPAASASPSLDGSLRSKQRSLDDGGDRPPVVFRTQLSPDAVDFLRQESTKGPCANHWCCSVRVASRHTRRIGYRDVATLMEATSSPETLRHLRVSNFYDCLELYTTSPSGRNAAVPSPRGRLAAMPSRSKELDRDLLLGGSYVFVFDAASAVVEAKVLFGDAGGEKEDQASPSRGTQPVLTTSTSVPPSSCPTTSSATWTMVSGVNEVLPPPELQRSEYRSNANVKALVLKLRELQLRQHRRAVLLSVLRSSLQCTDRGFGSALYDAVRLAMIAVLDSNALDQDSLSSADVSIYFDAVASPSWMGWVVCFPSDRVVTAKDISGERIQTADVFLDVSPLRPKHAETTVEDTSSATAGLTEDNDMVRVLARYQAPPSATCDPEVPDESLESTHSMDTSSIAAQNRFLVAVQSVLTNASMDGCKCEETSPPCHAAEMATENKMKPRPDGPKIHSAFDSLGDVVSSSTSSSSSSSPSPSPPTRDDVQNATKANVLVESNATSVGLVVTPKNIPRPQNDGGEDEFLLVPSPKSVKPSSTADTVIGLNSSYPNVTVVRQDAFLSYRFPPQDGGSSPVHRARSSSSLEVRSVRDLIDVEREWRADIAIRWDRAVLVLSSQERTERSSLLEELLQMLLLDERQSRRNIISDAVREGRLCIKSGAHAIPLLIGQEEFAERCRLYVQHVAVLDDQCRSQIERTESTQWNRLNIEEMEERETCIRGEYTHMETGERHFLREIERFISTCRRGLERTVFANERVMRLKWYGVFLFEMKCIQSQQLWEEEMQLSTLSSTDPYSVSTCSERQWQLVLWLQEEESVARSEVVKGEADAWDDQLMYLHSIVIQESDRRRVLEMQQRTSFLTEIAERGLCAEERQFRVDQEVSERIQRRRLIGLERIRKDSLYRLPNNGGEAQCSRSAAMSMTSKDVDVYLRHIQDEEVSSRQQLVFDEGHSATLLALHEAENRERFQRVVLTESFERRGLLQSQVLLHQEEMCRCVVTGQEAAARMSVWVLDEQYARRRIARKEDTVFRLEVGPAAETQAEHLSFLAQVLRHMHVLVFVHEASCRRELYDLFLIGFKELLVADFVVEEAFDREDLLSDAIVKEASLFRTSTAQEERQDRCRIQRMELEHRAMGYTSQIQIDEMHHWSKLFVEHESRSRRYFVEEVALFSMMRVKQAEAKEREVTVCCSFASGLEDITRQELLRQECQAWVKEVQLTHLVQQEMWARWRDVEQVQEQSRLTELEERQRRDQWFILESCERRQHMNVHQQTVFAIAEERDRNFIVLEQCKVQNRSHLSHCSETHLLRARDLLDDALHVHFSIRRQWLSDVEEPLRRQAIADEWLSLVTHPPHEGGGVSTAVRLPNMALEHSMIQTRTKEIAIRSAILSEATVSTADIIGLFMIHTEAIHRVQILRMELQDVWDTWFDYCVVRCEALEHLQIMKAQLLAIEEGIRTTLFHEESDAWRRLCLFGDESKSRCTLCVAHSNEWNHVTAACVQGEECRKRKAIDDMFSALCAVSWIEHFREPVHRCKIKESSLYEAHQVRCASVRQREEIEHRQLIHRASVDRTSLFLAFDEGRQRHNIDVEQNVARAGCALLRLQDTETQIRREMSLRCSAEWSRLRLVMREIRDRQDIMSSEVDWFNTEAKYFTLRLTRSLDAECTTEGDAILKREMRERRRLFLVGFDEGRDRCVSIASESEERMKLRRSQCISEEYTMRNAIQCDERRRFLPLKTLFREALERTAILLEEQAVYDTLTTSKDQESELLVLQRSASEFLLSLVVSSPVRMRDTVLIPLCMEEESILRSELMECCALQHMSILCSALYQRCELEKQIFILRPAVMRQRTLWYEHRSTKDFVDVAVEERQRRESLMSLSRREWSALQRNELTVLAPLSMKHLFQRALADTVDRYLSDALTRESSERSIIEKEAVGAWTRDITQRAEVAECIAEEENRRRALNQRCLQGLHRCYCDGLDEEELMVRVFLSSLQHHDLFTSVVVPNLASVEATIRSRVESQWWGEVRVMYRRFQCLKEQHDILREEANERRHCVLDEEDTFCDMSFAELQAREHCYRRATLGSHESTYRYCFVPHHECVGLLHSEEAARPDKQLFEQHLVALLDTATSLESASRTHLERSRTHHMEYLHSCEVDDAQQVQLLVTEERERLELCQSAESTMHHPFMAALVDIEYQLRRECEVALLSRTLDFTVLFVDKTEAHHRTELTTRLFKEHESYGKYHRLCLLQCFLFESEAAARYEISHVVEREHRIAMSMAHCLAEEALRRYSGLAVYEMEDRHKLSCDLLEDQERTIRAAHEYREEQAAWCDIIERASCDYLQSLKDEGLRVEVEALEEENVALVPVRAALLAELQQRMQTWEQKNSLQQEERKMSRALRRARKMVSQAQAAVEVLTKEPAIMAEVHCAESCARDLSRAAVFGETTGASTLLPFEAFHDDTSSSSSLHDSDSASFMRRCEIAISRLHAVQDSVEKTNQAQQETMAEASKSHSEFRQRLQTAFDSEMNEISKRYDELLVYQDEACHHAYRGTGTASDPRDKEAVEELQKQLASEARSLLRGVSLTSDTCQEVSALKHQIELEKKHMTDLRQERSIVEVDLQAKLFRFKEQHEVLCDKQEQTSSEINRLKRLAVQLEQQRKEVGAA